MKELCINHSMGTVSEHQRPSPPGYTGGISIPPYYPGIPQTFDCNSTRRGADYLLQWGGGGGCSTYELFFKLLSMGNVSATIPPGHTPDISLHDSVRGGPLTSEGDLYVHELFFLTSL